MIKQLQNTSKFFAVTEEEAKAEIMNIQNNTHGVVTRQDIQQKEHKKYGEYYEVTVVEKFQTSKDILEELV